MKATDAIAKHGPCNEAVAWIGKRTPKQAWEQCPRGDWLLWIAARVGVDRKLIVRAACDCARTALKYVPRGEDRPRIAIETAERWCDGTATIGEVRAAADAAYAAHAAHPDAAYAAAYATYAAYVADAAYAAAYATYAAYVVDAAYAAADAARSRALKRCAALVRKRIPWAVVRAALRGGK